MMNDRANRVCFRVGRVRPDGSFLHRRRESPLTARSGLALTLPLRRRRSARIRRLTGFCCCRVASSHVAFTVARCPLCV